MNKVIHYIGLDVHKESIAVSIAPAHSTEIRRYGIIGGTLAAVDKLLKIKEKGSVPAIVETATLSNNWPAYADNPFANAALSKHEPASWFCRTLRRGFPENAGDPDHPCKSARVDLPGSSHGRLLPGIALVVCAPCRHSLALEPESQAFILQ
jgi:hypothetical protein